MPPLYLVKFKIVNVDGIVPVPKEIADGGFL
jgi:hypothetical protein